ncbi:hypothetical protein GQX74_000379 [Glossina fuscipes]|nr:hypothetical protein GQX74_000379 [Glossina fuscipes]
MYTIKVEFVQEVVRRNSNKTVGSVRNGIYFEPFPKNMSCVVVSLVWYDANEDNGIHHQLGGILSDRIIITSWAPDFSHERESRGYCVLGFDLTKGLTDDQVIPWRTVVSADNSPAIIKKSADAKNVFKIALINLERSIPFGKYIGGYKFAALPSVNQSKGNYENLHKIPSSIKNTTHLNAFLPFLHGSQQKQLMVARALLLHPDFLRDYRKFYEPQGKEAPFWMLIMYIRGGGSGQLEYRRNNCAYMRGVEGSPIIYNHGFLGINFYHEHRRNCMYKGTSDDLLVSDTLLASRVDLYAN